MRKILPILIVGLLSTSMLVLQVVSDQQNETSTQSKFLGNIFGSAFEPTKFSEYWDQVTPENAGKWGDVETSRDFYSWTALDSIYNYAMNIKFPFKLHTLVWGNQTPNWMDSLSEQEQREEVEEWIREVGNRYPASRLVDVVNEPLHFPPSYKEAIGGDNKLYGTGWDWVVWSFEKARQYLPNAKLLINEYGIEWGGPNLDIYIDIINILKSRALIDGIGVQGHGLESIPASTLRFSLDKLAQTGLPIYISEYDVDKADDNEQLNIYKAQFPIFWEHPSVKGVTLWGYIQGQTWKTNAYLLRYDNTERPALTWLMQYARARTGWRFYGCNQARTAYYPIPTAYKISDAPFQTLWSSPHEGKNLMALTGDVNGDGKLEVVKVSGDNLKVISGDGKGLWTSTIPGVDSYYGTGYLRLDMLEDVTGDSIPEIFVSRKTAHTTGNIYVYDGNGNLLKTLTRTVGADGNMYAVAVFDTNKDGTKTVLASLGTNFVGNPRGAVLVDYNTGTELWYYAAGNSIGDSIADLNNDGLMEITSGWWTVHNGAWGRGKGANTCTDDSSVYLVVINERGDEIFTKQIHDTHSHGGVFARIVDLNKDGTKELVAFHGHESNYPGTAEIYKMSASGTIVKTYTGTYNSNWNGVAIGDINKDGKDEIIVGSSDGNLRILDYNLNLVKSRSDYNYVNAINDLNGDGLLEIIASDSGTRKLGVLKSDLTEIWSLSFPVMPQTIVSDVNGDGANDLLIIADQLYVASNPTTTKTPTPIWDPKVNKISLRYEMKPTDTEFSPSTNVQVSIYDISKRDSTVLLNLEEQFGDMLISSFTFNAFKNRDADPRVTREEVLQNFFEAIPSEAVQKLSSYIPKTHVLYSDLSTTGSLFANFGIEVLEGKRPQTTQAFAVLTFITPVPLAEPAFIYSQYGYKLDGNWYKLGGGFGTGTLIVATVYCKADLQIIDSFGRKISKTVNEIPGAYYIESDFNRDGQLDDRVILPETPNIEYIIMVLPEPDATPDDTFTLEVGSADLGFCIAENVRFADIPEEGYRLNSLQALEEMSDIIPPSTTIIINEPEYTDSDGNIYVASITPFTLTAEDNPDGTGVASTLYRIYNSTYDTGWMKYSTPFYLTGLSDGEYSIDYYSIDNIGNVEPTNTATVILDNTSPITTLTIGEPKYVSYITYVTLDTPFILEAEDPGAGVNATTYRIYNSTYDSGWITYTGPLYLTSLADGTYTIEYYSIDNIQNVEATQAINVTLFSWDYIFEDTYGRGTILKINLAHKFFHFIAPDKDFGIKFDANMTILKRGILICYEDREMRLITIAVDNKLDFCVAIAWDLQTSKQYFLIDKVGVE